jgi:hypothetical protein
MMFEMPVSTVIREGYNRSVSNTLTVRLTASHSKALTRRAKALGQTRSQVVRDLIEKGLDEQPLGRSIGDVKGRLELSTAASGWRRQIKSRNWRPPRLLDLPNSQGQEIPTRSR